MSSLAVVTFLLVATVMSLVAPPVMMARLPAHSVKWCTVSDAEQSKCLALSQLLSASDNKLQSNSIEVQCEQKSTRGICMWNVGQGTMDVVVLSARDLYFAGKSYGLIPVVGEKSRGRGLRQGRDDDDDDDDDDKDCDRDDKNKDKNKDDDKDKDKDDDDDDDDDDKDKDKDDDDDKDKDDDKKDKDDDNDKDDNKDKGDQNKDEDERLIPAQNVRPFKYKAVVVIRRNNTRIRQIADLRGARSCHTYVEENAGWELPISLLLVNGLLSGYDCLCNIEIGAKFFSQSCVPESQDPSHNFLGEDVSNLCALCGGDEQTKCTKNDPYAGYIGSFKCLQHGRGEVSFTKHNVPLDLTRGESQPGSRREDFQLLCPDGSRRNLNEYNSCNWGVVPPNALMASPHLLPNVRTNLKNVLLAIQKPLQQKPYLLTEGLFDPMTDDYRIYTGPSFIRSMENQSLTCASPVPNVMRWCVVSNSEVAKCHQMALAFQSALVKPRVQCVLAASTKDCMIKIRNGAADLVTLDGGDIYTGGKDYGLVPIAYEDYGENTAKYYAVAIAKKSDPTVAWPHLRGRKSCHTGVGRTAGWNVPISLLGAANQIQLSNPCDILKNVANYFCGSCSPGALDVASNIQETDRQRLCSLCKGEGPHRCERKAEEPYYGYTGAFRCLVEGGGDVAFVNHLTVTENTDGKNQDLWARNLSSSDFELLCADGRRQRVDRYRDCNLAKVPAHAVVTAGTKSEYEIDVFVYALLKAQSQFSEDSSTSFRMFDSDVGAKNVLFRDATQRLVKISKNERNYERYLESYIETAKAVDIKQCKQLQ